MNLEITLRELSAIIASLNNFVQVPIPAKYSWRLGRVMKSLQSEVDSFSDHRAKLFRKYGEEVKPETEEQKAQGTQFKIKPEHMEKFTKELNDLLSEIIEIEFDQIPISLIEDSKMTIADMVNLDLFFLDDEERGVREVKKVNKKVSKKKVKVSK